MRLRRELKELRATVTLRRLLAQTGTSWPIIMCTLIRYNRCTVHPIPCSVHTTKSPCSHFIMFYNVIMFGFIKGNIVHIDTTGRFYLKPSFAMEVNYDHLL